ncbi:MAG: fasciclin domain-containing protein [Pseudomonadota bacterium]|nr:fasciclin domain-containing protein [Pseudomonadota bacterium]
MKTNLLAVSLISACALAACSPSSDSGYSAPAESTPAVAADTPATSGAATMAEAPSGDITDVAMGSADHTTLVAAVKAADLVDTLKSSGPFTVFAPTNAAFDALPAGTVDTLLMPENKDSLTQVLTYHVVAGDVDAATLTQQIEAGNGSATLTTVQGATLTAKAGADGVTVTDAQGNVANVIAADLDASNGVVHVVDRVLMQ